MVKMLLEKINYLHKFIRKVRNLFLIFLVFPSFASEDHSIIKVDFDESMGIAEMGRYELMLRDHDRSDTFLSFYRDLYNSNFSSTFDSNNQPKIPKIIHQIWIGPKPFPEKYVEYAQTCTSLNPGWEYKLWTNDDVEDILAINPKYTSLYKEYEKHGHITGQKDILEFLILYKNGGLFLDADIKCIKSFEFLHYNYDFYSAMEPANRWSFIPIMTNAIVGSKKNNQIFIDTLDLALQKYDSMYKKNNSSYKKFIRSVTNKINKKEKDIRVPHQRIVLMLSLGENLVAKNEQYNEKAIVFPATYFNPIVPLAGRYDVDGYLKYFLGIYDNKGKTFTEIKPETIAIQDFFDN